MAESKATPKIYAAMQGVMKGIANVPKTGKMQFGATNYDYLKADDVQSALSPLLNENNIVVSSEYDVEEFARGNRQYVYVHLSLTYISSEDGSSFPTVRATGEAIAGDDKSINKALTQSIKNAHRATFQFASGEAEPDDYAGDKAPGVNRATTPPAVENARQAPAARKPSARADLKTEFLDTGKVTREDLNARLTAAQSEGRADNQAEAMQVVLEDLRAGK